MIKKWYNKFRRRFLVGLLLLTFSGTACMAADGFSSGIGGENAFGISYYSGEETGGASSLAFTPFESSSYDGLSESPALYGPGGDPIGGLPVGNDVCVLSACVFAYAFYKLLRRRKTVEL